MAGALEATGEPFASELLSYEGPFGVGYAVAMPGGDLGKLAVAAVLGEQCPIPMRRVGVKDVFGHSGPAWELLEQFGLRSDAIIAAVKELV